MTQSLTVTIAQRKVVEHDVTRHVEVEDVFGAPFGRKVQGKLTLQRVDRQGLLQIRLYDINA